jgi:hypothetical protein
MDDTVHSKMQPAHTKSLRAFCPQTLSRRLIRTEDFHYSGRDQHPRIDFSVPPYSRWGSSSTGSPTFHCKLAARFKPSSSSSSTRLTTYSYPFLLSFHSISMILTSFGPSWLSGWSHFSVQASSSFSQAQLAAKFEHDQSCRDLDPLGVFLWNLVMPIGLFATSEEGALA